MSQRYYVNQWPIQSLSGRVEVDRQGQVHPVVYTVSLAGDGHFECSCGAWKFQRKWMHQGAAIPKDERDHLHFIPDGHCKHIQFVINHREQVEEAVANRATVSISHEDSVIEIQDGRIVSFLQHLEKK